MSFVLRTRSGTARFVGQPSIWTVSLPGPKSLQKIPTTQDGDARAARTLKFRFLRTIAVSAARLTTLISIATLPLTPVASSAVVQEIAHIHATSHVILAPALHVEALALCSLATVAMTRSSSAVLIPTFRSRQESLAMRSVASSWDAENILVRHCAMLDCARPAKTSNSKNVTAGSMNGRLDAATETQRLL